MKLISHSGHSFSVRLPHINRIDWLYYIVCSLVYIIIYYNNPARPLEMNETSGWWSWWDQNLYLKSAMAWASFDLNSQHHWYPPGYPMAAALFIRLIPGIPDPFFPVNAISFLLCIRFVFIICTEFRIPRFLACIIVLVSCLSIPDIAKSWVVPWTTTPAVPIILASIITAYRGLNSPSIGKFAITFFLAGSLLIVRPFDGVLLAASNFFILLLLFLHKKEFRSIVIIIFGGAIGLLLVSAITAIIHFSIYGLAQSPYMQLSANYGFEPRLLVYRWITMVIDPRPFLIDGLGMVARVPWLLFGFVGIILALFAMQLDRRIHIVVVVPILSLFIAYLIYRDINSYILWKYGLNHYFKLFFLICGIYTGFLTLIIWRGVRTRQVALSALLVFATVCWKVNVVPTPYFEEIEHGNNSSVTNLLRFKKSMESMSSGYAISIEGLSGDDFHSPLHKLTICEKPFHNRADFVLIPRGDEILMTPLRPLPIGNMVLSLAAGRSDGKISPIQQQVSFGFPCWIPFAK